MTSAFCDCLHYGDMDVDLTSIPGQVGTAVLDAKSGSILKANRCIADFFIGRVIVFDKFLHRVLASCAT